MTSKGYEAEPILSGLVRVWAPCGCELTFNPNSPGHPAVLTCCLTEACNFNYQDAKAAYHEMLVDFGIVKLLPEVAGADRGV